MRTPSFGGMLLGALCHSSMFVHRYCCTYCGQYYCADSIVNGTTIGFCRLVLVLTWLNGLPRVSDGISVSAGFFFLHPCPAAALAGPDEVIQRVSGHLKTHVTPR